MQDLEQIGEFTDREWGAAQKRKYLDQLMAAFAALRDRPGLGTARGAIESGLRSHPAGRHVVYYRDSEDTLVIVRVLHQRMGPDIHFGQGAEI